MLADLFRWARDEIRRRQRDPDSVTWRERVRPHDPLAELSPVAPEPGPDESGKVRRL